MPDEARLCTNWWLRGACEDVTRADLGDRGFTLGGGFYTSLWAHTWGVLRPHLRDASNEIVAVGVPMSAVPCVSRFWTGCGEDGTRLITWENFFLGRDTNTPVNAQVELGYEAFYVRSNDIERVYQRIDPDDWDGDDVPNAWDPNPYIGDGIETDLEQVLPEGANEDAYCWVDLTSERHTRVSFTGDGYSNLPDPSFMLRSGDVCRVALLIGKTYTVTSDQPLRVVDQSDCDIEIEGDGTTLLTICWPVEICAIEGNGAGFMMDVCPWWLGGTFNWTSTCCAVTGYGEEFWYACRANCSCGGCCVEGDYVYEGYSYPCCGGWCDCPHDEGCLETVADDGPWAAGATVAFSQSAVIFEDAYTNGPGEVVARRSTNATLTCVAHGGERGGVAEFTLQDASRLNVVSGRPLPVTQFVPPGQMLEFRVVYEGVEPSAGEEDIVAKAKFTERETGTVLPIDRAYLTSIKLSLEAVYEAPENPNPSRHVYGVGEKVRFRTIPALSSVSFSTRKLDTGDDGPNSEYELFGTAETCDASCERMYTCPISANYHPPVKVSYGSAEYRPAIGLVEPQEVITTGASWGENYIPDIFYSGNRRCWPYGEIGSACLVTTNYIGPMTVSFQGIAVSEVPCTEEDVITGSFTNGHLRTHTRLAGAGIAHFIGTNNFWFVDGARSDGYERDWCPNSRLNWKIPIGWHRIFPNASHSGGYGTASISHDVYSADYEVRYDNATRKLLIGGSYMQKMSIDIAGTYKTEKFGHWISRSRWCCISLDGEVLQTEHGEQ